MEIAGNHLPFAVLNRLRRLAVSLIVAASMISPLNVFADEEALLLRITKLERALDNQGLLDMFQRLEALQSEVQNLRGQIEDQQYTIERLRQSQRDAYVDLDRRLQESLQFRANADPSLGPSDANPPLTVYQPGVQPEVAGTPAPGIDVRVQQSPALNTPPVAGGDSGAGLPPASEGGANGAVAGAGQVPESGQAAPAVAMVNPPGAAAMPSESQAPPAQSADQAYREAFGLLKAGKYDESIEAFNLFLLDYPNSEYADNSQYWLGETYFVKQEYPAAIEQYQKLIANYPSSKKQSHALLKIGYSFQRLGELDKARAVLEDLQTRFPGSTAARLAAERIQQIAAGTP